MDLHQIDTRPVAEFVQPLYSGVKPLNLTLSRCDTDEIHRGITGRREEPVDRRIGTCFKADQLLRVQHHAERCCVREIETEELGVGGVSECTEIPLSTEGSKAALDGVDPSCDQTPDVPPD